MYGRLTTMRNNNRLHNLIDVIVDLDITKRLVVRRLLGDELNCEATCCCGEHHNVG